MPEEVRGHCCFGWKWAAAWGVAAAFLALATPELSMDPWFVLPLPDVRRSWDAPWARRIHIVEAHGDVLRHWPAGPAAAATAPQPWSEPVPCPDAAFPFLGTWKLPAPDLEGVDGDDQLRAAL